MQLELSELNQILKNLQSPNLEFVEKQDISTKIRDNSYNDGLMGEEDSWYKIYKLKSDPNTFLRVEYYSDSYGSGEFIRGAQFVQPANKTMVVYEPI